MSNAIFKPESGIYVVGSFLGYEERPWANDSSKMNRRIGIKTGEYDIGFGQSESNIQQIDIQSSDVDYIKRNATDFKGKLVCVPVIFKARAGGRNGAFLGCFMPKNSKIELIKN